jgi:hypothetical protein
VSESEKPRWETCCNPEFQDLGDVLRRTPRDRIFEVLAEYVAVLTDGVCHATYSETTTLRCLPVGADGVVYFAVAQGSEDARGRLLVKIGHTSGEVSARVASLQTGCPHRLVVERVSPGSPQVERDIHLALSSRRVHGEWFRLTASEIEDVSTFADGDWSGYGLLFCHCCGGVSHSYNTSGPCWDCERVARAGA